MLFAWHPDALWAVCGLLGLASVWLLRSGSGRVRGAE